MARGHTYTADGSVYFRIASFPEYGRLSRLDVAGIQAGARVDTDKYDKENARDFVLWKLKSDEPAWAQWEAPFGKGRPGWHIECSAMSMKYLGETFDLHAAARTSSSPTTRTRSPRASAAPGKPFARHWMHVKHLLIDNETMSKSKGNFFTIPDLLEKGPLAGGDPLPARGLPLPQAAQLQLRGAAAGEGRAGAASTGSSCGSTRWAGEGPEGKAAEACAEARRAFDAALADDLNTPEALAAVHGLVGRANALLAEGALTRAGAGARPRRARGDGRRLRRASCPRGGRTACRPRSRRSSTSGRRRGGGGSSRRADAARARLEALGVVLEDTPKGTRWRRKR